MRRIQYRKRACKRAEWLCGMRVREVGGFLWLREGDAGFAALDRHVSEESQEMGAYVLGLRHALNVKGELDMAETS